jgi:hypothetical protein
MCKKTRTVACTDQFKRQQSVFSRPRTVCCVCVCVDVAKDVREKHLGKAFTQGRRDVEMRLLLLLLLFV